MIFSWKQDLDDRSITQSYSSKDPYQRTFKMIHCNGSVKFEFK
jgi:hypothetical protein